MKNNKKNILILFILLVIAIAIVFLPEFLDVNTFIQGHDSEREMMPFYLEMQRLMGELFKGNGLPFYSWNMFLGTNFYASQTFYVFGELFGFIGLLIKTDYFTMSMILDVVKLFTAGVSMYTLLCQYKLSNKVRYIGAICYAMSTWGFAFSDHPTFLTFYAFAPLFFTGMEFYLQKNKFLFFTFITTLLLTTNYYYFYTLCCFAPIYFLSRYYLLELDWHKCFLKIVKLIGFFALGIMMGMFLFMPSVLYILGNDRVGELSASLFYKPQVYWHILSSMYLPQYKITTSSFYSGWYTTDEIFALSSLIITVLLPQAFVVGNKRLKRIVSILCPMFILIALFPFLCAALHGFGEPSFRWTMFFIMFSILVSSYILENLDKINKKMLFLTVIISLFCIIGSPLISFITITNNYKALTSNIIILWPLLVSSILVIVYSIITIKKPKHMFSIIICLVILETSFNGHCSITRWKNEEINTYTYNEELYSVLQDSDGEFKTFLNNIEEENTTQYFRTYVPFETLFWQYGYNMPLAYGYEGLMTYDSTYAPSLNKLIEYFPEITRNNESWTMSITDPDLMTFLNVKYLVVEKEDELPKNGNYRLITNEYRSWISVYRNDDYRSIGNTYHKVFIYPDSIKASSLLDTLYVNEEDYDEIKGFIKSHNTSSMDNVKYHNNQMTGYIYSDDDSFMVVTLPYDQGWNILVNGQKVKTYEVNAGFIGIPINKGDNSIEMYFTPKGFKEGCYISVIGFILTISIYFIGKKKNSNKNSK